MPKSFFDGPYPLEMISNRPNVYADKPALIGVEIRGVSGCLEGEFPLASKQFMGTSDGCYHEREVYHQAQFNEEINKGCIPGSEEKPC